MPVQILPAQCFAEIAGGHKVIFGNKPCKMELLDAAKLNLGQQDARVEQAFQDEVSGLHFAYFGQ